MKPLILAICLIVIGCSEGPSAPNEEHRETVRSVIERMHAGETDTGQAVVVVAGKPNYRLRPDTEKSDQVVDHARAEDKLTTMEKLINSEQ